MLRSTPSPRRRTARRTAPGLGRELARGLAAAAGVIVLLTMSVGLSSPSGASTTQPDQAPVTITPPVERTPEMGPESGPQLTIEVWNRAIRDAVVMAGATKLGAPYVYSAGGPNAFDCSGFVRWAWMQLGVTLPHNSVAQWLVVDRIRVDELRPGDLVFDSLGGPPEHVSIYAGDGMMIHAPNRGGVVRYDPVGWWTGARVTAGRVPL